MRTKWVKVLIIGKGYVGTYLYNKLKEVESVRVECVQSSEFDYTDPSLIEKKLYRGKYSSFPRYDYVINCAGFTGRPNVDEGELKKDLCYKLNTYVPLNIANLCKIHNINYIHISSGCIYTGYQKAWTEDDEPNFGFYNEESSTYSKSKHAFETACPQGLILRVRMPFCDSLHERNYLTKLKNYDRLVQYRNSKTYITELVKFIEKIVCEERQLKEKDIVNFVNDRPLVTSEVTELMTHYGIGNPNWEFIDIEKLNLKANRSNCTLSTEKLKEKYDFELMSERVAIKLALVNMSNE